MDMRRFILIGFLVVFGSIVVARPAAAQSVLPASFGGWNASEPSVVIPSTGLNQVLGSDAAIFREYYINSLERRTYSQGARNASITLYRMRDPSSAYGAYTYLRNDSLTPVTLGSFGCASPQRALIVIGHFLIDVAAQPSRPSDAELRPLADSLYKVADRTPFPTIGAYLPKQGLVYRSEHYVLGPRTLAQYVPLGADDWMGFNYSAETIVGRYRLAGKDATLLVTSYPTQQIAADKLAGMLRRFSFDPPGGVQPGKNVLYGKRSGWLVAIVVGAPSRDAANTLLDQIQNQAQITWDEPKHTLTDPSIGSIIIGTFLGTGIIMLLAVAVGVGFGGFRVLMKIFFPNKVFDRQEQIEILQLGIFSKPIQATDFYQKPEKS
jgi:hypothetical protein